MRNSRALSPSKRHLSSAKAAARQPRRFPVSVVQNAPPRQTSGSRSGANFLPNQLIVPPNPTSSRPIPELQNLMSGHNHPRRHHAPPRRHPERSEGSTLFRADALPANRPSPRPGAVTTRLSPTPPTPPRSLRALAWQSTLFRADAQRQPPKPPSRRRHHTPLPHPHQPLHRHRERSVAIQESPAHRQPPKPPHRRRRHTPLPHTTNPSTVIANGVSRSRSHPPNTNCPSPHTGAVTTHPSSTPPTPPRSLRALAWQSTLFRADAQRQPPTPPPRRRHHATLPHPNQPLHPHRDPDNGGGSRSRSHPPTVNRPSPHPGTVTTHLSPAHTNPSTVIASPCVAIHAFPRRRPTPTAHAPTPAPSRCTSPPHHKPLHGHCERLRGNPRFSVVPR